MPNTVVQLPSPCPNNIPALHEDLDKHEAQLCVQTQLLGQIEKLLSSPHVSTGTAETLSDVSRVLQLRLTLQARSYVDSFERLTQLLDSAS